MKNSFGYSLACRGTISRCFSTLKVQNLELIITILGVKWLAKFYSLVSTILHMQLKVNYGTFFIVCQLLAYNVIGVLTMHNMLLSHYTSSAAELKDNSDTTWKFTRAQVHNFERLSKNFANILQ